MVNTPKNFLIMLNNLQQVSLKLVSKRLIKKTAEATRDLIGSKIADGTTDRIQSQKIRNKIIQKQLRMSVIKKHLEKGLYLQNKDKRLLLI